MSAALTVSASDRHSKSKPCPICGGHAQMDQGKGERCWGFEGDSSRVFCTRIDNNGAKSSSEDASIHFRDGRCQCGQPHADGSNPKPDAWQKKSMDWRGEAPRNSGAVTREVVEDPPKPWSHNDPAIETVYPYTNDQGSEYIVEVVRFTDAYRESRPGLPKTLPRYRTEEGVFFGLPSAIGKTEGVHLYRQRDALDAIRMGYSLHICEGEKDAGRAKAAGLCATTNICGALSFKRMHAEVIAGAWRDAGKDSDLFLVLDRDKDGVRRGERIAERLIEAGLPAARIRAVQSATEGAGDDLADHLEAGFGPNDLKHVALKVLVRAENEQERDAGADLSGVSSKRGPALLSLEDVVPEAVQWLWNGYIPAGKVTDVVGDGDLGKSIVLLDFVARVTTGRAMPGEPEENTREPRNVLLLVAEDDIADTVVPRLKVLGADLSRVTVIEGPREGSDEGISFPEDVHAVEEAIRRTDAALLVIDPVMAFIGKMKSGIDSEVRDGLMNPLKRLASKYNCAVLSLRHVNKSEGSSASMRGGGSVAFRNATRAGLAFGPDHDDESGQRRFMAPSKSNLGRRRETLAYRIESTFGLVEPEGIEGTPIVIWEGIVHDIGVSDVLGPPPKATGPREGSKTDECVEFIRERLEGGRAVASKEMLAELEAAGFKRGVIESARRHAGVDAQPTAFGGSWLWTLN